VKKLEEKDFDIRTRGELGEKGDQPSVLGGRLCNEGHDLFGSVRGVCEKGKSQRGATALRRCGRGE